MSKLRVVFIFALVASFLLGVEAMAAARNGNGNFATDSGSIFTTEHTLSQRAVYAAFLYANAGIGADSWISISNLMAPDGVPGSSDVMGTLSIYLYKQGSMEPMIFDTGQYAGMDIGAGLGESGMLYPGGTYTVQLSEIIGMMDEGIFAGYAWVVANFDAVAGTYANVIPTAGYSVGSQMEPPEGGMPVAVPMMDMDGMDDGMDDGS